MYGSNPAMMGYNPYFNQGMMMPQQGMMQQVMMPGQMSMMNSPQQQQQAMMKNQAMMNMQMQQMCAKQEPPGATATPNTGADKSSFVSPNMTSTAEAGNVTNNFSPMAAFSNMYGMPMGGNTGNKTGAEFREFFNGYGMHASAVSGNGTASMGGGGNIGQMKGMDDIQYMMFVRQQHAARQQMMAQNGGTPNNMMPSMGGIEVTKKDLDEKVKQMKHFQSMMGQQASPYRGGGDSSQQRQDSMLQNQYRSQYKFTPSANMGYNC